MFTDPYQVWQWRDGFDTATTTGSLDLAGFDVQAADGCIGVVDESSAALGATCLVVDNDPWIAGRRMLVPAGTVESIDYARRVVHLDRNKAQIETSPECDPATFARPHYYDMVAHHFAGTYHSSTS